MSQKVNQVIRSYSKALPDGGYRTTEDAYHLFYIPAYDTEEPVDKILNSLVDYGTLDDDCCGRFHMRVDDVEEAIVKLGGCSMGGIAIADDMVKSLRSAIDRAEKNGDSWIECDVY